MSDSTSQDQAAKARIVKHMNADHHDSVHMIPSDTNEALINLIFQIIRYLQHFHSLSSISAYDGKLVDLDLSSITLSCHGKTYRIPLDPPMKSYRDARERVVELDKQCRRALGQSDVTVKAYIPPTGKHAIPFLVILATFVAYSQRWWFGQGQIVESVLGSSFANFSWKIQPKLLLFLVVVHGAEMIYFAAVKLRHHSVNIRSPAWWLWTASTFIEGQFCYRRFDASITAQREKQRH